MSTLPKTLGWLLAALPVVVQDWQESSSPLLEKAPLASCTLSLECSEVPDPRTEIEVATG